MQDGAYTPNDAAASALNLLARAIARAVVDELRGVQAGPTHYTSENCGPVSSRAFVEACRSGELRGSKIGKRWIVAAHDFNEWVASRRPEPKPLTTPEVVQLAGWTRLGAK
jgi:hypothetical protein